ncbi:hypothetical protein U0070_000424, partial [Myodes glareolus]
MGLETSKGDESCFSYPAPQSPPCTDTATQVTNQRRTDCECWWAQQETPGGEEVILMELQKRVTWSRDLRNVNLQLALQAASRLASLHAFAVTTQIRVQAIPLSRELKQQKLVPLMVAALSENPQTEFSIATGHEGDQGTPKLT